MTDYPKFEDLLGKTLVRVETAGDPKDEVLFVTDAGESFKLYHSQDCCESVEIESVVGDLADLVGSPILRAEEVTHENEDPPEVTLSEEDQRYRESFTWTFYKLATIKGSVDIRFYGTSNGYYSESVDFERVV